MLPSRKSSEFDVLNVVRQPHTIVRPKKGESIHVHFLRVDHEYDRLAASTAYDFGRAAI